MSVVVQIGVTSCKYGGILSIRRTWAILFHIIQSSFLNMNSYVQFPVNKYHVALNHVVHCEHQVNIDCTSPLIHHKFSAGV